MGVADLRELRPFGEALAALKEPEPPKGFKDMMGMGSLLKTLWNMAPTRGELGALPGGGVGRQRTSTWRGCRCSTAGPATWRR